MRSSKSHGANLSLRHSPLAAQFIAQHQKRYHICRLWASIIAGVILACTWAAGATGITATVMSHGAQHVLVTIFGVVGGMFTIWQRIW